MMKLSYGRKVAACRGIAMFWHCAEYFEHCFLPLTWTHPDQWLEERTFKIPSNCVLWVDQPIEEQLSIVSNPEKAQKTHCSLKQGSKLGEMAPKIGAKQP